MPSPAEHTQQTERTGETPRRVVPILRTVDLPVRGMTCASCAARIEKKLNRMDGVQASVNYATGTAHVTFPADLDPAELVATVERTGYAAQLPQPPHEKTAEEPDAELAPLRRRLLVGALLGLPVLLLGMIPALRFDAAPWVSLLLASPVALW